MKKLHEQFKTKIIYLAHPYTNDPKQSFINACEWTAVLRTRGLVVFSPIMHTHPYHEYLCRTRQQTSRAMDTLMNYVGWDLDLLTQFKVGDGYISYSCVDCGHSNVSDQDPLTICELCHRTMIPEHHYDSHLVVLMSKTAFDISSRPSLSLGELQKYCDGIMDGEPYWESFWLSQGCRQEYEWAKTHHVRVLELESFLENLEVDL